MHLFSAMEKILSVINVGSKKFFGLSGIEIACVGDISSESRHRRLFPFFINLPKIPESCKIALQDIFPVRDN